MKWRHLNRFGLGHPLLEFRGQSIWRSEDGKATIKSIWLYDRHKSNYINKDYYKKYKHWKIIIGGEEMMRTFSHLADAKKCAERTLATGHKNSWEWRPVQ